MRFAVSPEQAEFAHSLRRLLAGADTPAVIRAWAGGDHGPGRKLWAQLAELGVTALAVAEEHGGFGATPVDLVLGFVELGRAAVPGPYVESVAVLPPLLARSAPDRIAPLVAGEVIATLAAPPLVPRALDVDAADVVYCCDGKTLSVAAAQECRASIDGARRLSAVTAHERLGAVDAPVALDLGTLATAAQLLGAGEAVLESAAQYARQRVQFGRAIGSFQAVKHLLADARVALELARPLLFGAALAFPTDTRRRDVSAAKIACGDAAYRAARAALQVHGAIGYTAEHDLALWLTRIRALQHAWGTQRLHRDRVLAELAR
jgi:alkylation response protein AidB-like acyl-CoA dehydrogenase